MKRLPKHGLHELRRKLKADCPKDYGPSLSKGSLAMTAERAIEELFGQHAVR